MKNRKKYLWLGVILLLIMLLVGMQERKVYAADGTVKIYIGDSTSVRHHMAICLGMTSEEYSYSVKEKYTVKSSNYTSSNPEVFSIVNTKEGKCKVKTNKEGTGWVILTINTKEGDVLTEKVFVSVYTPITNCYGVAKRKANVYRGATTNGGVENEDLKGSISKDKQVKLTAACENFYIIETLDGSSFADAKKTGFIRKQDIQIPVTGVVLDKTEITLETGSSMTLHATVNPELSENKKVIWKSDREKIADVNQNGVITAKKTGVANIFVITEEGEKTAKCKVTVSYEKKQSMPASNSNKAGKKKPKNGKMNITVTGVDEKRIKISWKAKSNVKRYEIYRAKKKNGKYKKIKNVKKKKTSYIDKTVKSNKVYYYRVLIVKKNGKKIYSKKGHGKTIKIDAAKNLAYIRKVYPNICTNTAQNMNNYIINGIYSPIKYKFDGKTMEIHVYLDFVKYENTYEKGAEGLYIYKKTAASKIEGIQGQSYISLFKSGIMEGYNNILIKGSDKDFPGCNFRTKMILHVKGEGEALQAEQKYVEILIGGECPNCDSGRSGMAWYHGNLNWNSKDAYIENPGDYRKYYIVFIPTN